MNSKLDLNKTKHHIYIPADKKNIWVVAMEHAKELDRSISEYINIAVKEKLLRDGKIIEVVDVEKKD